VEPPARSRGPRSRSTGTVTVAELLARYTGAVLPTPPPGTGYAVSVAALLRREGRGPHMADRPLLPRGHVRLARALAAPPRHNVRRAAAAAGALFAATAVLGPSMVDDGSRGLDTDLALPLADLPDSPAFDWFGDTARAGSTAPEELASATARQLIAGAIPSEVDGSVLEDIAGPRDPSTPDRAQGGSTGPVAASGSGTIPPGGSGTPPGGTWSWPFGPAGSPAAPAGVPADGDPGEDVSGGGPAGGGGIGVSGGEGPGVSMALSAPTVTSPPVHVPSTSTELPVAGLFRSPAVTAGKGVLAPPGVSPGRPSRHPTSGSPAPASH
jgi:hypothetical protein